jgi:hypothetical protein
MAVLLLLLCCVEPPKNVSVHKHSAHAPAQAHPFTIEPINTHAIKPTNKLPPPPSPPPQHNPSAHKDPTNSTNQPTTANPGERNFHIFYQCAAGFNKAQREAFGVTDVKYFNYLSQVSEPSLLLHYQLPQRVGACHVFSPLSNLHAHAHVHVHVHVHIYSCTHVDPRSCTCTRVGMYTHTIMHALFAHAHIHTRFSLRAYSRVTTSCLAAVWVLDSGRDRRRCRVRRHDESHVCDEPQQRNAKRRSDGE